MANVGHCVALKCAKDFREILRYLENGLHPNHKDYKEPEKVRGWGIKHPGQFQSQCEVMLRRWFKQHRLHCGRKPKVKAWWWMPRFADGANLEKHEMRRVERVVLSVLPAGCVAVFNWHVPKNDPNARRNKGPDFNFVFSNVTGHGPLKSMGRDSQCSMWGLLRDALEYVVDELNIVRRMRGHTLIPTMAQAQTRKRGHTEHLRLSEQLSMVPGADQSAEKLQEALATLGYAVAPSRREGFGYIRRLHCPVLTISSPQKRFKGKGYYLSLEKLRLEVGKILENRKAAELSSLQAQQHAPTSLAPAMPSQEQRPAPGQLESEVLADGAKAETPQLSEAEAATHVTSAEPAQRSIEQTPDRTIPAPAAAEKAWKPTPPIEAERIAADEVSQALRRKLRAQRNQEARKVAEGKPRADEQKKREEKERRQFEEERKARETREQEERQEAEKRQEEEAKGQSVTDEIAKATALRLRRANQMKAALARITPEWEGFLLEVWDTSKTWIRDELLEPRDLGIAARSVLAKPSVTWDYTLRFLPEIPVGQVWLALHRLPFDKLADFERSHDPAIVVQTAAKEYSVLVITEALGDQRRTDKAQDELMWRWARRFECKLMPQGRPRESSPYGPQLPNWIPLGIPLPGVPLARDKFVVVLKSARNRICQQSKLELAAALQPEVQPEPEASKKKSRSKQPTGPVVPTDNPEPLRKPNAPAKLPPGVQRQLGGEPTRQPGPPTQSGQATPPGKRGSHWNPDQEHALRNTLVARVLTAVTARDTLPMTPLECNALAQRAGVHFKVWSNDDDKAILRFGNEECEINVPAFQLVLCMAMISARVPTEARRSEREALDFVATDQDGVLARHRWLPLIVDSWDRIRTFFLHPAHKALWITAFSQANGGKPDDWATHLYLKLTASDVDPNIAELLVLSQVPTTVSNLESLAARLPKLDHD